MQCASVAQSAVQMWRLLKTSRGYCGEVTVTLVTDVHVTAVNVTAVFVTAVFVTDLSLSASVSAATSTSNSWASAAESCQQHSQQAVLTK
jgi:hypothetical protein